MSWPHCEERHTAKAEGTPGAALPAPFLAAPPHGHWLEKKHMNHTLTKNPTQPSQVLSADQTLFD